MDEQEMLERTGQELDLLRRCTNSLLEMTRAEQRRALVYLQDRFMEHQRKGEAHDERDTSR